jgi:uncharacterized protein (TIGR03435 family)
MKRVVFGLLAFAISAFAADDFIGTWQGTLNAGGRDLRMVMKLALSDDKLAATLYSIDQGAPPLAATSVVKNGSTIKIKVTQINGEYEGKLSGDGKTITGTWSQGSPLALNLTRATPETAWTIPEPPPPPTPMAADAKPSFEVATIKPAKGERGFSLLVNRSGMLNTTSTSLADLIKFAYDMHPRQITGGPQWLEMERFDVTGKPDTPGLPSVQQLKGMVQRLLAERFALKFHTEKKELPVYAITLAKNGHKMTKNESNPKGLPGFGGGGPRGMVVRNARIEEFAHVLQANILEKPVVDQTGLGDARWDFVLKWTPDPSQRGLGATSAPPPPPSGAGAGGATPGASTPAGDPDAPPDLFAAFEQQLGLHLQSTKAPVDVMVIEKVEKPSEN